MSAKVPIKLKITNRMDLLPFVLALYVLAFTGVIVNPMPVSSVAAVAVVSVAAWIGYILDFSKSNNNVELTSVIFPDGKIQLESGQGRVFVGVLNGQHWCISHLAVLRIIDRKRIRNLVILRGQGRNADEFRRLRVWLRQDLGNQASAGLR
jgi:hypothetical protein